MRYHERLMQRKMVQVVGIVVTDRNNKSEWTRMAVKRKKLTVSEVEAEIMFHTKNAENRTWDLELMYRPLFHERYDVPL